MTDLYQQARKLAARNYSIAVYRDDVACYAEHPELPGCMADGKTPDEAVGNLAAARVDYIYALLEWGIPVEPPNGYALSRDDDNLGTLLYRVSFLGDLNE
jgi:predicted RNase H-like HicB family nuclease